MVSVQDCYAGDLGSIPGPGKKVDEGWKRWEVFPQATASPHQPYVGGQETVAGPAWDVEQPLISSPRTYDSLERILTPRLGEFSGGVPGWGFKKYTLCLISMVDDSRSVK